VVSDDQWFLGTKYQALEQTNTVKLYSLWDYINFIYFTIFWTLNKMWSYNERSYFSSCDKSFVGLAETVGLFIDYLSVPLIIAFRDTTFALVTTLEYPYPITVFCYSAIYEVQQDLKDRLKIFILRPEKLIENLMRYMGTISYNLMTAPDCLDTLDGTCFGTHLGIAVNLILQP
jgi:hypothetical protein